MASPDNDSMDASGGIAFLRRQLSMRDGSIRIRLPMGLLKDIDLVISRGFSPLHPIDEESRRSLPIESQEMGKNGIPLLLSLIRDSRLKGGRGVLGANTVIADYARHAFIRTGRRQTTSASSPRPADALLDSLGVRQASSSIPQWKDDAASPLVLELPSLLKAREVFVLGARRTTVFSEVIGVPAANHICVPDTDAYGSVPYVSDILQDKILKSKQPVVVLNAASLVGNTVMLKVSSSGVPFIGNDIGLIAALFDWEYLSGRGWFRELGDSIVLSCQRLASLSGKHATYSSAPFHLAPEYLQSELIAANTRWKQAVSVVNQDTDAGVRGIQEAIDGLGVRTLPLMSSTMLIWLELKLGRRSDALLAELEAVETHIEAWLAAAAIRASRGQRIEALTLVGRVAEACPLDSRVRMFSEVILSNNFNDSENWLSAMNLKERNYPGSQLSWSLIGNMPSGWR